MEEAVNKRADVKLVTRGVYEVVRFSIVCKATDVEVDCLGLVGEDLSVE
jgi:hypothetical protein